MLYVYLAEVGLGADTSDSFFSGRDVSTGCSKPSKDSGPTFTSNAAPKNNTTRIKTSKEILRALKILEIFILSIRYAYTIKIYILEKSVVELGYSRNS